MSTPLRELANTHSLPRSWPEVLAQTLAIQAIPAPTFAEQNRAKQVEQLLADLGLHDVTQDEVGNVYARTPGSHAERPAVLISAHLDTVFPVETDLSIRHDQANERVYGPGIGDNSLGLAALISLARWFSAEGGSPPTDIWWVATVGEEGLGDLRGMRRTYERLRERLGVAIILEGIGLGRIYHAGLGVRRLQVTIRGPGGHSWLHRERPSAIHQLVRLAVALLDEVPLSDHTALNIGLIEGGVSINTLAPEASLSLDLRATDQPTLTALEAAVRELIERFNHVPDLHLTTQLIGNRPGAALSTQHPLVEAAQNVLHYLNYPTPALEIGSTDANLLLANGIPTVCIGITTGGNAHTTDEYIDVGPITTGMNQLALLALLACRHVSEWQAWS